MNPKFEVEFETEYHAIDERHYLSLLDVIPKSLSFSCPHCQVYSIMRIDSMKQRFKVGEHLYNSIAFRDSEVFPFDFICTCPSCDSSVFVQAQAQVEAIFEREDGVRSDTEVLSDSSGGEVISIYPSRRSISIAPEVPEAYANDFREAALVLDLSPMASAALSRRILQNILRNEFKIQHPSLAKEIEVFITQPGIPTYLTGAVDAIRKVGNLAAHPLKNTNTGEIVVVEPGEAEWLIEVLLTLFDFKFVQPKRLQERKDQLNAKLQNLGQPPMK